MDEVFGNSSGETVVESSFQEHQILGDYKSLRRIPTGLLHSDDVIFDIEYTLNDSFDLDSPVIKHPKKFMDLNATQEIQIEQNSENHQIEEIQFLTTTQFVADYSQASSGNKNSEGSLNKTIEDYLSILNKEHEPESQSCNLSNDKEKICSSKDFQPDNSSETSNKLLNSEDVSPNTIYQLPPMRYVKPEKTDKFPIGNFEESIQQRPRTHTASSMAVKHLYQNLPVHFASKQSPSMRKSMQNFGSPYARPPTYVNVPAPRFQKAMRSNSGSPLHKSVQMIRHAYQQQSLSDTECDDIRKHQSSCGKIQTKGCKSNSNSPGYVQMSSPYVRSPVSSVYAQLASSLANYAGQAPQTIFCPLCPRQFGYERILTSHIQKTHKLELEAMVEGQIGDLSLQCCPICQARFFNRSVLPKHLIDCHKDSLIQLLEKHKCIQVHPKGMQCPFCVKSVPIGISGEHVLIFHLQQYHQLQFEDMVNKAFELNVFATMNSSYSDGAAKLGALFGFDPGASSTPGLSDKMGTLIVNSDSKRKLEDMENDDKLTIKSSGQKVNTPKSYEKSEPKRSVSKGILRRANAPTKRPNVKRELRFSVPHVTKEEIYYPESPGPETPISRNKLGVNAFSFPEEACVSNCIFPDVVSIPPEDVDMNQNLSRKRRRLGLNIKSGKIFRCRDKENSDEKMEKVVPSVYMTSNVRTFRKPKPVAPPTVPKLPTSGSPCASKLHSAVAVSSQPVSGAPKIPESCTDETDSAPFSSLKLYSPLRLFKCTSCRHKFCDNDSLVVHINQHHRSILSLLRPQFGCGVCTAKFYENKYLVRHCLQHHTSLLEIRSNENQTLRKNSNQQVTAL